MRGSPYLAAACAALVLSACTAEPERSTVTPATEVAAPPEMSAGDQKFIQEVGRMTIGEVTTSEMALERSETPAVRDLAQAIIDYHAKADPEFMSAAHEIGYDPPSSLDNARRDFVGKLDQASGPEFDRIYFAGQQMDHEQSLELFRKEAGMGADHRLRAFATENLPALERVSGQVEQVAAVLGGTQS